MKDLLDKISSYNIFNFLLPGIIFAYIAKQFTTFNFIQEDVLTGAFFYYFVGLIISRFGSLVIEPILKKTGFVKFTDYKDYVTASKLDPKIELLSEVNNTFRTLLSTVFLLLLLKAISYINAIYDINHNILIVTTVVLLFIMFLFSYRKQTNYITKRIKSNI
jgi:hypothetical protein